MEFSGTFLSSAAQFTVNKKLGAGLFSQHNKESSL
jgi:hypothetical protein